MNASVLLLHYYFSILFLCSFQFHTFTVLERDSNQPISEAKIIFYLNGSITSSTSTTKKGKFRATSDFDSIQILHSDYKLLTVYKSSTAPANRKLYLESKFIRIDEVKVSKNKILGNHTEKSQESVYILQKKNLALLFENKYPEKFKLGSLYLNLRNVSYRTDIVLQFLATDTITKKFFHSTKSNKNKTTELTDVIPNEKQVLSTVKFTLYPGPNQIVEIDLSNENIIFQKNGLFVSIVSENIYDLDGVKLDKPHFTNFPAIYLHKTMENNYCRYYDDNLAGHWVNYNLHQKYANEKHVMAVLIQPKYFEPSIGISLKEIY